MFDRAQFAPASRRSTPRESGAVDPLMDALAESGDAGSDSTMMDPLLGSAMVAAVSAAPPAEPLPTPEEAPTQQDPFGSMGDGKGSYTKGTKGYQGKKRLIEKEDGVRMGGRVLRDWKGATMAGGGIITTHKDGSAEGSWASKSGHVLKGFNDAKEAKSSTRADGTTTTDRTHEVKAKDGTTRTKTHESFGASGASTHKRDVRHTSKTGDETTLRERTVGTKNGGYHTVDDGDREVSRTYETTEKTKKEKAKEALGSVKEKLDGLGDKIKRKKKDPNAKKDIKQEGPKLADGERAQDAVDPGRATGKDDSVNTVLRHLKIGGVGDESGIDYESFLQERETGTKGFANRSGSDEVRAGTQQSAQAGFGGTLSGSAQKETRTKNGSGLLEVTKAGATGEISAGAKAEATHHSKWTTEGIEKGASASASAGAGAEGALGITHQSQLGHGFSAESGATAKGKAFVGGRAEGSATVTRSSSKVGATAAGSAMAGAEAEAAVGASSAITHSGFEMVGGRAKAAGEAMAGAKASANASAKASTTGGVEVAGGAKAIAGAEASGNASVGASLGGVETDAVADGEAMAGAMAGASGEAAFGPMGLGIGGELSAFAGAKAGGQVRAELGAGGLNFGVVGASGDVRAGAGAEASGEVFGKLHKTGASAEAGAAVGVGAGLGFVLTIDPSFPVRLPLEKLAEHKILPSADIGKLASGAVNGTYFDEQGAPHTLDAAKTAATDDERVGIQAAQKKLSDGVKGGGKRALGEVQSATSMGGALREQFSGALTDGFAALADVGRSSAAGLRTLAASGMRQVAAAAGNLYSLGNSIAEQIRGWLQMAPAALLELDVNSLIDSAVARMQAMVAEVLNTVDRVVNNIRESGRQLVSTVVNNGLTPLSALGSTAGSIVRRFTGTFAAVGRRAVGHLRSGLTGAEEGHAVEQTGGEVRLQVPVSPTLKPVDDALAGAAGGGEQAIVGGVNKITDNIGDGLKSGLGEAHEDLAVQPLADLASSARNDADKTRGFVQGVGSTTKALLRPIIAVARAAKAAAEAAAKAAKKVAQAAVTVAKKAASVVGKVVGWIRGIFG